MNSIIIDSAITSIKVSVISVLITFFIHKKLKKLGENKYEVV